MKIIYNIYHKFPNGTPFTAQTNSGDTNYHPNPINKTKYSQKKFHINFTSIFIINNRQNSLKYTLQSMPFN